MVLSDAQLNSLETTERAGSVLSLLGTTFIIVTFLSSRAFHKPVNRLVFYASLGNVLANVGTMISRSGILVGGGVCQFQGFLIQMFLPADAMWTLAMATNVYLTFFRKYDAQALRALEWKYFVICYGLPFLPAFAYFFIKTQKRGKVYGDAVLWCWVDIKWDYLRVALFYGPVWAMILITFAIYILTGKEIFQKRRALKEFSSSGEPSYIMSDNPFMSTKTTEVQVTSEPAPSGNSSEVEMKRDEENPGKARNGYDPYSVSIGFGAMPTPAPRAQSMAFGGGQGVERPRVPRPGGKDANKAALSYARVAVLFFAAILVTWVPSTINRVFTLVHPDVDSYPLNFLSALVLPLQGLWNAIIYIFTSMAACRSLWGDIKESLSSNTEKNRHLPPPGSQAPVSRTGTKRLYSRDGDSTETESTKGFARS
ncbi:putative camp receptor-like protein [Phaeomoniella chlamydospora]|uniref:Putative camp receptor-like protein n=1 Tax=Phaeomoniella chlamydospora TaxID=158046 RepID=A0A0G2EUR8_PHACM|nr:putative camp receptor-like protein [Phaeomoniella chlamydospora]